MDYPIRRDWSRSSGKLNYSSFVYFDVDRDGRYGLGDRPMGGIAARLSGAKGHMLTSRTNANGFANSPVDRRVAILHHLRLTEKRHSPPPPVAAAISRLASSLAQSRRAVHMGEQAAIGVDQQRDRQAERQAARLQLVEHRSVLSR